MVVIGIDPHRGSHTAVAIDKDEHKLDEVRLDTRWARSRWGKRGMVTTTSDTGLSGGGQRAPNPRQGSRALWVTYVPVSSKWWWHSRSLVRPHHCLRGPRCAHSLEAMNDPCHSA